MKTSSTHSTTKLTVAAIAIIAIVLLGLSVIRYNNPTVGFRYFEPNYLPPGISIKEKRINIMGGQVYGVQMNFRTVDWVYSIYEQGIKPDTARNATTSIGTATQNYDPASIQPTCSLLYSPLRQRYRLCHWVDYGRIGVYQVKFVKNGTLIDTNMPTSLQEHLTVGQLGRFVDSFTRKSTFGIPVLRTNGA